jgi:hypothetical protein
LRGKNGVGVPDRDGLDHTVCSLVDNQLQYELPTSYCSLSDHTLPVLDVVCGSGLFPDCRIVTCSQDHSVKVRLNHTPFFVSNVMNQDMGLGLTVSAAAHDIHVPPPNPNDSNGQRAASNICSLSRRRSSPHQPFQTGFRAFESKIERSYDGRGRGRSK